MAEINLYDATGSRKYLISSERQTFFEVAKEADREIMPYFLTLFYTGCRVSEALELTPQKFDYTANRIIIRSLKKRKQNHHRHVPVPPQFLRELNLIYDIQKAQKKPELKNKRLWTIHRSTVNRRFDKLMEQAGIVGVHATPKGLRHSFAINALENDVPIHLVSRWMGHSSTQVTEIYLQVLGKEEDEFMKRMWKQME